MEEKYLVLCFDENKYAVAFNFKKETSARVSFEILKKHSSFAQIDLVKILDSSINNQEKR